MPLRDPPFLFDMTRDPYEKNSIDVSLSDKYNEILSHAKEALEKHKLSIKPVQGQFSFPRPLWHPHLQHCCNPPYCRCVDPRYASVDY